MFAIAYSHVQNREDADDIVQEAGLRLCQQRREPADARGLAYTLADHSAHEWLERRGRQKRGRGRSEPLDPTNPAHQGQAASAEREALAGLALAEAIEDAPVEALLLGQGYHLREVAAMTGGDYRTIWSRVQAWRRGRAEE